MIEWLYNIEFWIILGLVLVIFDLFLWSYFFLPIGMAAFATAFLLYSGITDYFGFPISDSWGRIIATFGALSVIAIFVLRYAVFFRKKDRKDINQY